MHRVHDKNGLVIPRRWHPSSCLQLLPFSHSLVSESAYSWLSPRLPVIPSTVNSHVFASTTFHCQERLVQGSSAVPPEMPLRTIAPLSDAFNQIRTGESWADFSSWPGINVDDQLSLGKAMGDPEVEGREKGCLRDSGSMYV